MLDLFISWLSYPVFGVLAAMAAGAIAYLLWKQFRDRTRRRYYRDRERERRAYWGFE
jgi:hypothetical protein